MIGEEKKVLTKVITLDKVVDYLTVGLKKTGLEDITLKPDSLVEDILFHSIRFSILIKTLNILGVFPDAEGILHSYGLEWSVEEDMLKLIAETLTYSVACYPMPNNRLTVHNEYSTLLAEYLDATNGANIVKSQMLSQTLLLYIKGDNE